MPNINNITSPVTLISYGRSGSSLLSKVFELHPEFSMVGETGNFIGDLWNAYDFSMGQMAPSIINGQWLKDDERAGLMVRSSFLSCFPDDKKQWFHKPIGVPTALSSRFNEEEWDKAAIWYWNAMNHSFPNARFFTLLRHPFDVVLSAKAYWGFDEAAIWKNYTFMAYLLSHPACPITYAISFEEMTLNPEVTIRSLFKFIGVSFDLKVMDAFGTIHAASSGREQLSSLNVSRKDAWTQLDFGAISSQYLEIVSGMFSKYKQNIEIPNEIYSEILIRTNEKIDVNNIVTPENTPDIKELINEHNKKIELINSEHNKKWLMREREFYELFNKDQEWIAKLNQDVNWLQSKCSEWERATQERDEFISELQAHIENLRGGTKWLTEQRDAWERAAQERDQFILTLQMQIVELKSNK